MPTLVCPSLASGPPWPGRTLQSTPWRCPTAGWLHVPTHPATQCDGNHVSNTGVARLCSTWDDDPHDVHEPQVDVMVHPVGGVEGRGADQPLRAERHPAAVQLSHTQHNLPEMAAWSASDGGKQVNPAPTQRSRVRSRTEQPGGCTPRTPSTARVVPRQTQSTALKRRTAQETGQEVHESTRGGVG